MPIYQYECEGCGKQLEVSQRVSDPPPECDCREPTKPGQIHCDVYMIPKPMKRKIGKTSFQLKGQGWARDKYK